MDDVIEIDLRKIIKDLLVNWKWIVGFTLLAGAAAFAFSLLQPRMYSATALIAITRPRYLPNFDEQYQTINNNPPTSNAIIDLANSDEIFRALYQEWQSPRKANTTPRAFLEGYLNASAGKDPTTVVLKVTADTSEEAASLANAWAKSTAQRANQLFSGTDGSQVEGFQAQVNAVEKNLSAAEAALTDFESRNQISVLNNQLASLLAQQADILRKQRLIESTVSDVNVLMSQVADFPADSVISGALQTNLLVLQLRIYNDPNVVSSPANTLTNADLSNLDGGANQTSGSSLQIQIPGQSQGSSVTLPAQTSAQPLTRADYVAEMETWSSALGTQAELLKESHAQLTGQITALQQQIQEQSNEKERLMLAYKNTQDVYDTLRLKLEEVKITSSDLYGNVQIASAAAAPIKADSRNTVRNTIIGLVAGGLLSMFGVLALKWWKSGN